ncbi:hypothetical protein Tsubulata_021386 [Turnera subulata]|uniref:Uncharacterized protein n=1 Tax=Turnera subulata TaxID=218843 RepID=A0A9Q0FZD5_9ROSI|nr:hypothetical protein Tsubulata_021386 [Turnera subulata]
MPNSHKQDPRQSVIYSRYIKKYVAKKGKKIWPIQCLSMECKRDLLHRAKCRKITRSNSSRKRSRSSQYRNYSNLSKTIPHQR